MTFHKTRESWLSEAVEHLTELYAKTKEDGEPVKVPNVVVAVGFAPTKARVTRGNCFPTAASSDGVSQIFISPVLGDEDKEQILVTMIHELAHAIDDCTSGHTGRFRKLVEQMGLIAPFTSATAGDPLKELLAPILQTLGTYPAGKINLAAAKVKKQTNRQLLAQCAAIVDEADVAEYELYANRLGETCGYKVRTTQQWFDVGIPECPVHGEPLELEDKKAKKT